MGREIREELQLIPAKAVLVRYLECLRLPELRELRECQGFVKKKDIPYYGHVYTCAWRNGHGVDKYAHNRPVHNNPFYLSSEWAVLMLKHQNYPLITVLL